MPRIRNKVTGAVMTVPEATAARLGSGWVDADKAAEEPTKRGGRPRKTESDD